MQFESDIPVSLEIDGDLQAAANPRMICQGECAGPLECLPDQKGSQANLDGWLERGEKRIFICDSTSTALRPLIPDALGFVFRDGAALGHFAGVLRHHHIPACIDLSLWQWARDVLREADTSREGRLQCGRSVVLSQAFQADYRVKVKNYRQRLEGRPFTIPVFDIAGKTLVAADTAIAARIGEKALTVNALQAEDLPTAQAIILINLEEEADQLDQDAAFVSLVEQVFPRFGRRPGTTLIVRGSLHAGDGSHAAWSGMIPSPSATSMRALTNTITSQVARWKSFRDDANRPGLSIILQERIASPVRGILATGRPWDFNPECIVAELDFMGEDGAIQTRVFLDDVEAALQKDSAHQTAELLSMQDPALDGKGLCDALAGALRDGLILRDRYAVPLDIEFVVTGDLRYGFVQFRPLFRL